MNPVDTLEALLRGVDMESAEATAVMEALVAGELSEIQAGAFLVALRGKGVTAGELVAFVRVLKAQMVPLAHDFDDLIDTCGTGGGPSTFNISTAAAIVAASAGARVAKHGNRAVTSRCGSADVLEFLGVRLTAEPEHVLHLLETARLAFLFAPAYHPALKAIGPVRKALGVRTVFNQLGPLLNPASASVQLIGVHDPSFALPMAEALRELGANRAAVGCGENGLDEVSPCGPSIFWILDEGKIEKREISPTDFGVETLSFDAIRAGEYLEENASFLREAISDVNSPRSQAVIPSAGMALWLASVAPTLADAGRLVSNAIASGRASTTLDALIQESTV